MLYLRLIVVIVLQLKPTGEKAPTWTSSDIKKKNKSKKRASYLAVQGRLKRNKKEKYLDESRENEQRRKIDWKKKEGTRSEEIKVTEVLKNCETALIKG